MQRAQLSDGRPISIDKVDWRHINFPRGQTERQTETVRERERESEEREREGERDRSTAKQVEAHLNLAISLASQIVNAFPAYQLRSAPFPSTSPPRHSLLHCQPHPAAKYNSFISFFGISCTLNSIFEALLRCQQYQSNLQTRSEINVLRLFF